MVERTADSSPTRQAEGNDVVSPLSPAIERVWAALEAGGVGTWRWDLRQATVERSPNMEAIHRRPPGSFPGSFEAFRREIHPDDRAAVLEALRRALEEEREYHVEYRIRAPDGELIWLEARGRVRRDAEGVPVAMEGTCTDVTERKRTEARVRRTGELLSAVVENTTAAVFAKDREGRYTMVNRTCEELWGRPREELLGRTDRDLLPPDAAERIRRTDLEVLRSPRSVTVEERVPFPGGERVFLSVKVPLRDEEGRISGLCGVATDVTEARRAEEALRESETRFQVLADSAPVMIWMTGPKREAIYFNRAWLEFTGRRLEDELGDGWLEGVHPDDHAAVKAYDDAFRRREPFTFRFRLRRADGRYRWMHDTASPRYGPDGEFQGYVGTSVDITELRRAEEALREEARTLEALNWVGRVLAAELKPETLAQSVTDLATELTGARYGAFVCSYHDPAAENGDREPVRRLCARSGAARRTPLPPAAQDAARAAVLRQAGPLRVDDASRPSGLSAEELPFGLTEEDPPVRACLAVPVASRSGELAGGLFFGHPEPHAFGDRDERLAVGIAAQAAVALDNARLYEAAQREIAQRRRAEEDLQEAHRRKDQFLAMLSHELRNPLAPIRTCLTLLADERLPEDKQEWARGVLERQTQHLTRLVDDLLDISRITRGKVQLQRKPLNLSSLVRATVDDHAGMLRAVGLQVVLDVPDEPLWIRGDGTRLAQAIGNLLNNAAKFTPEGGRVVAGLRREGRHAVVAVRDTGIGMDADTLAHLFEPFARTTKGPRGQTTGLGLGLALAAELIERMGGELRGASEGPGHGSEFTVRLPLLDEEAGPPERKAPADAADGGEAVGPRRILLIEDNPDFSDSLKLYLESRGHRVEVAYGGAQGIEAAHRFAPDVVLCDIALEGVEDGYDVAASLRGDADMAGVLLVAVTGYGLPGDRRRALEAGFDDHLVKPVDLGALDRILSS